MIQKDWKILAFTLVMPMSFLMGAGDSSRDAEIAAISCQKQVPARWQPTPCEEGCRLQDVTEKNAYGKCQGRSGSATVDSGFFVTGSYTYSQAFMEDLDYASNADLSGSTTAAIQNTLTEKNLNFNWKSGFKLGIGYILSQRQQWDFSLTWTHQLGSGKGSGSATPAAGNFLRPSWLPASLGGVASQASAHWNMTMNVLDFAMGRNFFTGRWFSLHPQIGVRGAWIDNHYSTSYDAIFAATSIAPATTTLLGNTGMKAHWDFKSAGIRVGSDIKLHLSRNFAFLANGFVSLLYGNFKDKQKYSGQMITATGGVLTLFPVNSSLSDKTKCVRTVLETELGFEWETFFNKDKFRVFLAAYYDLACWFNQNEMLDLATIRDSAPVISNTTFTNITGTSTIGEHGNLTIQGWRFQLGFDF